MELHTLQGTCEEVGMDRDLENTDRLAAPCQTHDTVKDFHWLTEVQGNPESSYHFRC